MWQRDDAITGFSAGAYRNGNEVVISFAGTNETAWKDFLVANIPAGIGLSSAQLGMKEIGEHFGRHYSRERRGQG